MNDSVLRYEDSTVHYLRFGYGDQLLIAFHGYGNRADIFLKLKESLKERYTIYSLDLPFHGATKWNKNQFDRKDINAIIKLILEKEGKARFDLMGFSMGGRLVLKLLHDWVSKVDKVYLIATDGLKTKGMFNANLVPNCIKTFLKYTLQKPKWFIYLAKQFYHWKWIDHFLYRFVNYHFQTNERRERIFNTWRSLSHFLIYPKRLRSLLKKYPIPIKMYFGTKDQIIPSSSGLILSQGMQNIDLHEIEEGHFLIGPKLNALLKKQLQL